MQPMRNPVWIGLAAAVALLAGTAAAVPAAGVEPARWRPSVDTSWQIQLNGNPDLAIAADAYDVDLFETPTTKIAALQARGTKVICYFSAGSYENWRPDKGDFPPEALGRPLDGWPGERWLDVRHPGVVAVMEARLDLAVAKECDAVDPDNVDGYSNRTDFPLTGQHQLIYNRSLAQAAHARGLAIGLKNDVEQIPDLVADFDFTVNEQCFQYQECGAVARFVEAGKPVFQIEYARAGKKAKAKARTICPKGNQLGFQTQIKQLGLGAPRIECRSRGGA